MLEFLVAIVFAVVFFVGFFTGWSAAFDAWQRWCIKVRLARHNPITGEFEVIPERLPAETHKAEKEAAE